MSSYIYNLHRALRFIGKDQREIQMTVLGTLEGHLRAILGTLTVESIYKDREIFAQNVREVTFFDFLYPSFEFSFTNLLHFLSPLLLRPTLMITTYLCSGRTSSLFIPYFSLLLISYNATPFGLWRISNMGMIPFHHTLTRGWGIGVGKPPPPQLWKIEAGGPRRKKKKRGEEREKEKGRKRKEKKEGKSRKGRENSKLKVFLKYSFWLGVQAR